MTIAAVNRWGEAEIKSSSSDLEDGRIRNEEFAALKGARDTYIDFDVESSGEKVKAVRASVFRPST